MSKNVHKLINAVRLCVVRVLTLTFIPLLALVVRFSRKHKAVSDPCLPPGMPLTTEDEDGTKRNFIGSGNYYECKARLEPLLNRSVPCTHAPCSFNGVHQPEIDFIRSHFYGFSEFWYTMEDVYRMGGIYKFKTFEKQAAVRPLSLPLFLSLSPSTPLSLSLFPSVPPPLLFLSLSPIPPHPFQPSAPPLCVSLYICSHFYTMHIYIQITFA